MERDGKAIDIYRIINTLFDIIVDGNRESDVGGKIQTLKARRFSESKFDS